MYLMMITLAIAQCTDSNYVNYVSHDNHSSYSTCSAQIVIDISPTGLSVWKKDLRATHCIPIAPLHYL